MKVNKDRDLENLTGKLMKETSLEKPSLDFTSKVMAEVMVTATGASVYKPLISKKAWFIISGALISLVVYIMSSGKTNAGYLPGKFDLPAMNNIMAKSLEGFAISKIALYAVALLTVMLLIQIFYLKNYLNKRLGNLK